MAVTTVGMATPSFVCAAVFIALFSVSLGWFPVFGAGSGIAGHLYHMLLPSLALAIGLVGLVARHDPRVGAVGARPRSRHDR